MTMHIKSSAFKPGATIPKRHTADGDDVSPPLEWSELPFGTKCFAIICDDPDAPVGTWVQWVLWGLPADTLQVAEAVPTDPVLVSGTMQGTNDFRRIGCCGPSPSRGLAQRYFFKLFALNRVPDLKPGATKAELEQAIKGHVLAQGELMGQHGRYRSIVQPD